MEAKELIIGNYVSIKNHINLCKVIEIKEQTLRVEYFREDIKSLHKPIIEIERIKPILLTEEWLLKFGFDNEEDYWNHWNFNLSLYKHGDNWESNQLPMYIYLEYVHQLQNLYFVLTGEELTIKK